MGWQIHLLENTVRISNLTDRANDTIAQEIYRATCSEFMDAMENHLFEKWQDVDRDGQLIFGCDEYSDYLCTEPQVIEILKKHKVEGRIMWGDLYANGAGPLFWMHKFDGKGGYVLMKGDFKNMPWLTELE